MEETGRNPLFSDLLQEPSGPEADFPSGGLRAAILDSVSPGTLFEAFVPRVARFLDLEVEPARALLQRAADPHSEGWQAEALPGLRVLHFEGGPRHAAAHCGLVHLAPGTPFPLHRHPGDEWAFVLSGSAREDTGQVWRPGDLVRNPAGSRHAFEVLGEEPFLFVVVLEEWIQLERG